MHFVFIRLFFLVIYILPVTAYTQEKIDFFISNGGNDNNPGNTQLQPKKTLVGINPILLGYYFAKGNVKLALKNGDVFEENLLPPCPIHLTTYTDSSNTNKWTILNGSKEFATGWIPEPGMKNTFLQAIPYTGFTGYGINGVGSYSYMYVIEIDRTLEKTAPFTARKLLAFVTSVEAVENTPGSFYMPINTTDNPKPAYIHTSDGGSPNDHAKFRYEVTVRDWAVNSTYQPNNRFENLWVRGYGAGNGMIPSGANAYYNRMVFGPGAAIHHLVVRSGTIDHSLFLPGAKNTNAFAVVFYDNEGLGRHCTIRNSMFFDIPEPVYAHISYGTNYGAVEMDHVSAFADSSIAANGFMYTFDTDSVILNHIYTDHYRTGYNYGNAKYVTISNACFKDVSFGIGYSPKFPVTASVNNVLIKTTGTAFTTGIFMQRNTGLTLSNSIIHVVNTNQVFNGARAGSFVFGGGASTGKITATGNIFICEIDPTKSLTAATTNTDNGMGSSEDSWNNNVYVLLKGHQIIWTATNAASNNGSANIMDFGAWQRQSGQDKQSLFFDLRNDPRGLKAIFADPANGNYDLANTAEGNRIAALRAGMTDPVTCFLTRPAYEEAAAMIRNNTVLSVNSCRNPCLQNKIRVAYGFDTLQLNPRQLKLTWTIAEQQNIVQYELQRSVEDPHFETIAKVPVHTDTGYSFIDQLQPGIEYRYRLLIKPTGAGACYSQVLPVKVFDDQPFIIYPNPTAGKISISMNGFRGNTKLIVSNAIGQTISTIQATSWYAPLQMDLSGYSRGMYWLKVETEKASAVRSFFIR